MQLLMWRGIIHRKVNDSDVSGAVQCAFTCCKIDKAAFYKGTERFLSNDVGAFLVSLQLVGNSSVSGLRFDLFLTSYSSSPYI